MIISHIRPHPFEFTLHFLCGVRVCTVYAPEPLYVHTPQSTQTSTEFDEISFTNSIMIFGLTQTIKCIGKKVQSQRIEQNEKKNKAENYR